jgi:tRNA-2-methylthio-N6-dimethylallyladenosine synthase
MKKVEFSTFRDQKQAEYIEKVKNQLGKSERFYYIETYGCQMNVHDSEKLSGMLQQMGYTQSDEKAKADIILFNTCCVRENAELRVYGNLGALRPFKEAKPDLLIGICGCMMQQPDVVNSIKRRFKFVDIVFGSHNTHILPELIHQALQERKPVYNVWEQERQIIEEVPVKRDSTFMAWVTIMQLLHCSVCPGKGTKP